MKPPTPCTGNTSSESSILSFRFTNCVAKKHTIPATSPMIRPPIGPTKPEAGVIVPSPATMPVTMPSTLGLPNLTHSRLIQAVAPAAAPMCVTSMAMPAAPFAASALPALKPNQPTQSNAGAGHRHREVVRRHLRARKAVALADHQRRHERRDACVHVHDGAAGEVAEAHRGEPAAAPHPVRDRQIHDDQPQDREQQHASETRAFREPADDQSRRDDRERQLEHREHRLGDRAIHGVRLDTTQPRLRQAADEAVALGERGGIAEQPPRSARRCNTARSTASAPTTRCGCARGRHRTTRDRAASSSTPGTWPSASTPSHRCRLFAPAPTPGTKPPPVPLQHSSF